MSILGLAAFHLIPPNSGGLTLKRETTAGFAWYKDFAIGICVFVLFIAGTGELVEAFRTEPHNYHRLHFPLAMLAVAAIAVYFATCRIAVIAIASGIVGSRGLIAAVMQPPPARYIGLAAAIVSGGILWLVIRVQNEAAPPYDSDKSSWLLNFVALFVGVALAAVLIRSLAIILK